ncbi:hypothetical protein OIV83_005311 [Microbotryomycetes sp. JL201]|nr:hypothetical protein OIV83_005311 [Microbotryomycetes sp. JL201]
MPFQNPDPQQRTDGVHQPAASPTPQQSHKDDSDTSQTNLQATFKNLTPKQKQKLADMDKAALAAFEERFGGASQAELGQLGDDGLPTGMARNVQRNMFRLI